MNDSFENLVYPTLTDFFGMPPDIDSNNKIILLIYDIDEIEYGFVAGFFYQINQYLNADLDPDDPPAGFKCIYKKEKADEESLCHRNLESSCPVTKRFGRARRPPEVRERRL